MILFKNLDSFKEEYIKFKEIIETIFNNNYSHDWIEHIFITESDDNYLIHFKTYYIKTINKKNIINNDIIKNIILDILDIIKKKNISMSIYYLHDILQLDYEIPKLHYKYNDDYVIKNIPELYYMINFKIYHNKIKFFIKFNEFYECDICKINIELNNKNIFNKYSNIEKNKIKVCLFNFYEYTNELFIKNMFKNGFWVDIIHTQMSNNAHFSIPNILFEKNELLFKNEDIIFYYYDIFLLNLNHYNKYRFILNDKLLNLVFSEKNFERIIKNKIVIGYNSFNSTICIHHLIQHFNERKIDSVSNKLINNKDKLKKLNLYIIHQNFIDEQIMNCILESKKNGAIGEIKDINKYLKILNKVLPYYKFIKGPILKTPNKNENFNILSREEFYRLFNIDIEKKILVLYLNWPFSNTYYPNTNKNKLEEFILLNKFDLLINMLEEFQKNNYYIIIKPHMRSGLEFNNSGLQIIHNEHHGNSINKLTIPFMNILNKKFLILMNDLQSEILNYCDKAIIINSSSSQYHFYLYNIQALIINSKDKKLAWYPWGKLKEYSYGEYVYLKDLEINYKEIINKFISKDYKSDYKFYNNHLLLNDSYYANYDTYFNIFKNIFEKCSYNKKNICLIYDLKLCDKYDNKNVSYEMNENESEIILKIINIPNNSYGISIPVCVRNINEDNKFKVYLDAKIKIEEEYVFLRIYNGKKWIELKNYKLNKNYISINFESEFLFYNRSKWRISCNTKLVGQEIYIKNLIFTY
jgi:hypothetical protein